MNKKLEKSRSSFKSSPNFLVGFFALKRHSFKKHFLKPVSLVLVFTFSYTQLLWAADVRQMLLDAKASFDLEDTRRSGMDGETLASAQATQEAVIDQQNALQDLQNMNFSLTTKNGDILNYIGNTLSQVTRPDGTQLSNIQLDANGNIIDADLRLSDGSIQIYQNGQVIGYQTPDGTNVEYDTETGKILKTISKDGLVTTTYTYLPSGETVLDNPSYETRYDANGKLKQVIKKGVGGSTTYYTNGIIQKIVNSDGSQVIFNSVLQSNGDTIVTPQGASSPAPSTYIDPNGNTFYFDTQGNVTKIIMADNAVIENIVWDSDDKIKDALLTTTDTSKFTYLNKSLTQSVNPQGVTTVYSYLVDKITAVTSGVTYEYALDKTPTKISWSDGSYTTFNTSGSYKGLRDKEVTATGVTYQYDYKTNTDSTITVQKRQYATTVYNSTGVTGAANISNGQNPLLKFSASFPSDLSLDPSVTASAVNGTTKSLSVKLVSGTGSTYTFNGTVKSLGLTLAKDTLYQTEIGWETGRVAIYVYPASSARPSTPTAYITDRSWDPKFSIGATNAVVAHDPASSGTYTRSTSVWDKNATYQTTSPMIKGEFRFDSSSSTNMIKLNAVQSKVGNITRSISFTYQLGKWTFKKADTDSTTGKTTNTFTYLNQTLVDNKDYVAELRMDGTKANLYIYEKGQERPATPLTTLDIYDTSSKLYINTVNATSKGQILKNLSSPSLSTVQSTPLPSRFDFINTSSLLKPVVSGGTNSTDFQSITYDSSSNLKQVLLIDGTELTFVNGLLSEVLDPQGNPTTSFSFTESGLSNILGSKITQNGLDSSYDAEGKLSSVKLGDLTIHYKDDETTIDFIEKEDGTELHDLFFDAQGNILNATVITPEGEERVYENQKMVSLRRPDETELFYSFDAEAQETKLLKLITPERLTYNFDYTIPDIVVADLDPSIVLTDTLTAVKMQYDTNFNLKKVIRQNQEIISYTGKDILSIEALDEAPKVFDYQRDENGKILSYTVTQDNVVTSYDANNQPLEATIFPDADNPATLRVVYQYGKIREIYKKKDSTSSEVLTFQYTYSFGPVPGFNLAPSEEITTIEDLEEKKTKIYQGGNLLTDFDQENSVLSTYEYVIDKVSKVTVTRLGRTLHTYDYTYSTQQLNNSPTQLTIVTDEEGTVRTYSENKLRYLEKDKQKFSYGYADNADGEEIVNESLIEQTLSDGSRVFYDKGKVQRVNRPDGSYLTDVMLDADRILQEATLNLPDGTKKTFGLTGLLEELTPDNIRFTYEQNRLSKIVDSQGRETVYSYETDPNGVVTAIWTEEAGSGVKLKYDSEGNLLGMKLAGVPDIIDGSQDFLDSSVSPKTLETHGDIHLDTSESKFGEASASFDGQGDYLTLPDSTDWNFGSGDFTIETYVKFNSVGYSILGTHATSDSNYMSLSYNGGWSFGVVGGPSVYGGTAVANTWYHVAAVRSGNNLTLYVNGVSIATTSTAASMPDYTGTWDIGGSTYNGTLGVQGQFNGSIDSYRISKGIARYTQNFTPPTTSFKPDSYTVLLLHYDGIDRGYYAFNPQADSQGNITGYSLKGDLGEFVFDSEGHFLAGSRVTLPNALKTFFDSSGLKHAITTVNDTKLSTATFKFGNASGFFSGNGDPGGNDDHLAIGYSEDFDFGTGDFTIESWVQFDSIGWNSALFGRNRGDGQGGYQLNYSSSHVLSWQQNGPVLKTETWIPETGQWYHLAVTRSQGQVHFYVNGTELGSGTEGSADITGPYSLDIGADLAGNWGINGRLDDFRISKGFARDFSSGVPTEEYAPDEFTKLLLHFDDEDTKAFQGAQSASQGLDGKLPALKELETLSKMNFQRTLEDGLLADYRFGSLQSLYDAASQTTYRYQKGDLSEVMDAQGKSLKFSYEKDSKGNAVTTRVNNGLVELEYNSRGYLTGFQRNGFLDLEEVKSQTDHVYEGGFVTGYRSIDNDFETAQSESLRHGSGGAGTVSSQHDFPQSQTVDSITFKMYAHGDASGPYTTDYEAYYYVEVLRNGQWEQVPGSFGGTGSYGGPYKVNGNGSATPDSGIVTLNNLNLTNVEAIRAYAHGFGNSSGSGSDSRANGSAYIYEIQWTLADLANYTLETQKDSQGKVTGYSFKGFAGTIQYDSRGNLLSAPSALAQEADSLKNLLPSYTELPYQDQASLGVGHGLPPEIQEWLSLTYEAIPDAQKVISQEYSEDGILETQTKGDETVTLFENNKPSKVLDQEGLVLIEYSYDAQGNPTRIFLRNARDTLPDEILKAKLSIEDQRAQALEDLARQKDLIYDQIKQNADRIRNGYVDETGTYIPGLLSQLNQIQAQYDEISNFQVRGKVARSQKASVLNQVSGYIDDVRLLLVQTSEFEADQYASLNDEVKALSDRIEEDSQTAFTELQTQEKNLQKEILRQEVSPIVYDYYRRILGRDPDSEEYDSWIDKVDYESGVTPPEASAFFDGQGDYLSIPDSENWDFGTGSFTLDFWVKFNDTAGTQTIYSRNGGDFSITKDSGGPLIVKIGGVVKIDAGWSPSRDVWYHVAIIRSGTELKTYLNGGQIGPTAVSSEDIQGSAGIVVGESVSGWIDDLRISKGVARYPSNFTPSVTTPFVVDSNTSFLLRNGSASLFSFKDAANPSRVITAYGGALVDKKETVFPQPQTFAKEVEVTVQYPSVDPKTMPFQESGGQVFVEAENYHAIYNKPNRSWVLEPSNSIFSNSLAFKATGSSYTSTGGIDANSPRLDFKVRFDAPGTYYLWVRGYAQDGGSDSVFAGLDGTLDPVANVVGSGFVKPGVSWAGRNMVGQRVKLEITSAGDHVLNFWVREANFKFDKFILTKDVGFVPSGVSLQESPHVAAPLAIVTKKLTEALKDHLNALPELQERTAYVATVKQNVTQQINSYLTKSQADKEAFASGLGLPASSLINLSSSDAQKILTWLNSRPLHFGQSAFLALESLLDQKGIAYSRTDLATKTIVIDVLSGVISPLDDGDLVLSVYALNKVAGLYGLALSGANLTWEDLQAIYQANPNARVVAHINGNHYVIITGITNDSITYIDPGIGKDKENEVLEVSKEGFLKAWKGNVTAESSKLSAVIPSESAGRVEGSRFLTAQETMSIRGAFWGSLLSVLGFVFNIIIPGSGIFFQVASMIASFAEGDWISGLSSIVTLGFGDLGKAFGNIFKGAFNGIVNALGPLGQIINGIGQFFGTIYDSVKGFIDTALSFLPGIGSALQSAALANAGASIGTRIVNTALSMGVTFGVSKGLESIGVSPQIAGFFGSLAAGAIVGGIKADSLGATATQVQRANVIRSSILEPVLLRGVGELGLDLGLDPVFTNIIGLSLAAIGGWRIDNPTTPLQIGFDAIKPQLFSSLAQYGVEKLGTSLGLDPGLSRIFGNAISSIAYTKLYSTRYTGTPPPASNPGASMDSDYYVENGKSFRIPVRGTPEGDLWSNVIGFFRNNLPLIGITAASAYYASTGTQATPNMPPPLSVTLPPLPSGAISIDYQNPFSGTVQKSYQVNTSSGYLLYDRQTGFLLKRVTGNVAEEGVFNYQIVRRADGSFYTDLRNPTTLSQGTAYYTSDTGGKAAFKITENKAQEIRIEVESSDIKLDPGTTKDQNNKIINGIVRLLSLGLTLYVSDGQVSKDQQGNRLSSQELSKRAKTSYIFGNGFNNEVVPNGTHDNLMSPFVKHLEGDGFVEKLREFVVTLYEKTNLSGNIALWIRTMNPLLQDDTIRFIAQLNDPVFFANFLSGLVPVDQFEEPIQQWARNVKDWYNAWTGIFEPNLVDRVIAQLDAIGTITDGIAFAHSGFFAPLVKALEKRQYDVNTIINYEGPYIGHSSVINNPYLKRIINVWGTAPYSAMTGQYDDSFPFPVRHLEKKPVPVGDFGPPFIAPANFQGITNINIKIIGARHNDFSYKEYELDQNGNFVLDQNGNRIELWNRNPYEPERIAREINFKTNKFMRELYKAAKDVELRSTAIEDFLIDLRNQGSATQVNGVWEIRALELDYPLDYAY